MEPTVITVVGKSWWQSKTVWFNVLMSIGTLTAYLLNTVQDPNVVMSLIFVQGLANLILRVFFTASPIGDSKAKMSAE